MNFLSQTEDNKCASVALCNIYTYFMEEISDKLVKNITKKCSVTYNSNVFFDELERACKFLTLKSTVIEHKSSTKFKKNIEKLCSSDKSLLLVLITSEEVTHTFLVTEYSNNVFTTVNMIPKHEVIQTIKKDNFFKLLNKMKNYKPFMLISVSQEF